MMSNDIKPYVNVIKALVNAIFAELQSNIYREQVEADYNGDNYITYDVLNRIVENTRRNLLIELAEQMEEK